MLSTFVARCALLALLAFPAAARDTLRIHGSNTIGEALMPALIEAWLEAQGCGQPVRRPVGPVELRIEATCNGSPSSVEIQAHGSGTGISGLVAGRADLAMLSRPITPAELDLARPHLGALDTPAHEIVIALDGLAIIVHPSNPIASLSRAQVRAVFSGRIRDWSELGRRPGVIARHARDDRSGTWDSFRSMVLQEAPLAPGTRRYESTAALAAAVASDPDAIGFVGLAGVGRAKALAISDGATPVQPERFEVAVEDYPLSRRLYLYAGDRSLPALQSLLAFMLGEVGQGVVERVGFVSQNIEALAVAPRANATVEYRELVAGAERLSLNFRFPAGVVWLDSKAARDFERLAAYMREPSRRHRELILLGFADASEANPYHAYAFSADRADFVAEQLSLRGVPVRRMRGLGGTSPVADNGDEAGRRRNRRVEVWLR